MNQTTSIQPLLRDAHQRADRYWHALQNRRVSPDAQALAALESFREPLPAEPLAPGEVLRMLDEIGSPATVATAGPRYFGFVIGGVLPAALAANWLAAAWDQNTALGVMSPIASVLEDVVIGWVSQALGFDPDCGGALVTGATMANFSALAAARHALLAQAGWDVEEDGLFGAPPIMVVVGAEVHASVRKALSMLGLGRKRVIEVPVDAHGRMRVDCFPDLPPRSIVCIQAGNVNTGAFDPADELCERAHASGAWVHVDGAFGLWAAAAPSLNHLTGGFEKADSWTLDSHKWLNVNYDSGIVLTRHAADLRAAFSSSAAYFNAGPIRDSMQYAPEQSRRARAIDVWAALKSLGRSGLAELIERNCRFARQFSEGLQRAGYQVLNDVVLNQVLVRFGDGEITRRVIAAIQEDGTCWCGSTIWQGETAMRISVSSWRTTEDDVQQSLEAMLRCAERLKSLER